MFRKRETPAADNPLFTVDLCTRTLEAVATAQDAVSSGRGGVAEAMRASVDWELADIHKQLTADPPSGPSECASVLPAGWLKARWEAVCQPVPGWYPCYGGKQGLSYVHAGRLRRNSGPGPTSRCVNRALWHQIMLAEGYGLDDLDDIGKMYRAAHSDVKPNLHPHPDPLLLFEAVREMRAAMLIAQRKGAAADKQGTRLASTAISSLSTLGTLVQAAAEDARAAEEPGLVTAGERLKFVPKIEFARGPKATRIAFDNGNWVDAATVAVAVQAQRLAVLLLWLLYGKTVGDFDHTVLPYADIAQALSERGLLDVAEDEGQRRANDAAWTAVADEVAQAATRYKWPALLADNPLRMQAWMGSLSGGMFQTQRHLVVSVPRLSANAGPTLQWFTGQCDLNRGVTKLSLFAGHVCASAIRAADLAFRSHLCAFEWAELAGEGRAMGWTLGPGLDLQQDRPSQTALQQVYKPLKLNSLSGSQDGLIGSLLPRMSVLDPLLSLCWLAGGSVRRTREFTAGG